MAKASDNVFPKLLLAEGSAPATPATGVHGLFVDTADDKLKRIDSTGTVTQVEGSSTSGSGGGGIGARLTASATKSLAAATNTKLDLTTLDFNVGSLADAANGRFVAPRAGLYLVSVYVEFSTSVTDARVRGYVNAADTGSIVRGDPPANRALTGSRLYSLGSGGIIEIYAFTGGASTVTNSAWATVLGV